MFAFFFLVSYHAQHTHTHTYIHAYTHIHTLYMHTRTRISLSFGTLAHMLRFTWFLAYRCDKKIQGIKIYHVTTSLSFVIDEITRETNSSVSYWNAVFFRHFHKFLELEGKMLFPLLHVTFFLFLSLRNSPQRVRMRLYSVNLHFTSSR